MVLSTTCPDPRARACLHLLCVLVLGLDAEQTCPFRPSVKHPRSTASREGLSVAFVALTSVGGGGARVTYPYAAAPPRDTDPNPVPRETVTSCRPLRAEGTPSLAPMHAPAEMPKKAAPFRFGFGRAPSHGPRAWGKRSGDRRGLRSRNSKRQPETVPDRGMARIQEPPSSCRSRARRVSSPLPRSGVVHDPRAVTVPLPAVGGT
jgi:hypothetical protein